MLLNRTNYLLGNGGKTHQQQQQPNVCLTLPITCQICLSKVKEPSVCPNLHVFCSFCIEIWLEKTKQCPTCRIAITPETPCKRLLGGGIEHQDEIDQLRPTEFSHAATRKARYLNMFQQYEDEIERLNKFVDSLNDEIKMIRDQHQHQGGSNMTPAQFDMMQILKNKLQTTQTSLEESVRQQDELKTVNKKLESENAILIQDLARLKALLTEKTSQITSKYTMAALETKLESYEKEIKQLQKALEKSDRLIAELELKQNAASTATSTVYQTSSNSSPPSSQSYKNTTTRQVLDKNVKFADSTTLHNGYNSNRFYGSPSKTKSPAVPMCRQNGHSVNKIRSFNDRFNQEFESVSQPSSCFASSSSHIGTMSTATSTSGSTTQNLLFSPMKRLRLDDGLANGDLVSSELMIEEHNYSKSNFKTERGVNNNNNGSNEFIDCIELLNQAEKKVQNRVTNHVESASSATFSSSSNELCSSSGVSNNSSSMATVSNTHLASGSSISVMNKRPPIKKSPSYDQNLAYIEQRRRSEQQELNRRPLSHHQHVNIPPGCRFNRPISSSLSRSRSVDTPAGFKS